MWPAGLTLLLGYGAVSDVRQRRLPNWLALLLLAYGLTFAFFSIDLAGVGWHAAHALIALVVGMVLFAIRAFGGGDAKFYAGMAAYFPLSAAIDLLLWVSVTGLVTIIAWIIAKRLPPLSNMKREGDFLKFPYGLAIAVGGTALAWLGALDILKA